MFSITPPTIPSAPPTGRQRRFLVHSSPARSPCTPCLRWRRRPPSLTSAPQRPSRAAREADALVEQAAERLVRGAPAARFPRLVSFPPQTSQVHLRVGKCCQPRSFVRGGSYSCTSVLSCRLLPLRRFVSDLSSCVVIVVRSMWRMALNFTTGPRRNAYELGRLPIAFMRKQHAQRFLTPYMGKGSVRSLRVT